MILEEKKSFDKEKYFNLTSIFFHFLLVGEKKEKGQYIS